MEVSKTGWDNWCCRNVLPVLAYDGKRKDKILSTGHVGLQDRVCEVGAKLRQELACRCAIDGLHERQTDW